MSAGKHCLTCSEIIIPQEKLAPLGHSYEAEVKLPKCTEKGYTKYVCTKCSDSYIDCYTNPLGHSFDSDGKLCKACGELNPDYVSPLPTSQDDIQSSIASTASSDDVSESENISHSDNSDIISSEAPAVTISENNTSLTTVNQYSYDADNSNGSSMPVSVLSTENSKSFDTAKTTKAGPENALKINGEWINKSQKKTYIKKLVKAKKAFKVSWKKVSGISGYQIQYSTSKKFYSVKTKTKTVTSRKTSSAAVKKLKPNKKYYVRIRTYKTVKLNGKTYKVFSSWSKIKTVKTK